jgi:hypothetical protein
MIKDEDGLQHELVLRKWPGLKMNPDMSTSRVDSQQRQIYNISKIDLVGLFDKFQIFSIVYFYHELQLYLFFGRK